MLDQDLKTQLAAYLQRVAQPFEMVASLNDSDTSREMLDLLQTIQSLRSDKITLKTDGTDARKPSFTVQRLGVNNSLRFAGLPLGHEFTSLVLALLWTGGHPPKVEADVIDSIRALDGDFNFEVYIVTTDTHFSHKVWHETSPAVGKAKFPLVGDPTHQLTRAFDVHIDADGLAYRGTFVINPDGVIKTLEIHSNEIARDVKETLRKLKAAQYTASHPGEVCPAKWNEGAKTISPSLDLVGKI